MWSNDIQTTRDRKGGQCRDGETPVGEIKVKLGVNDATISKARKNILLPLALMVIDEPLFYKKYENILSDRAKKVITLKKGVAF